MAEPKIEMLAEFQVELGFYDENVVRDIRRAMARELRRRHPDQHVQVTMAFRRPPEPEPPPIRVMTRDLSDAEVFARQAQFLRSKA